MLIFINRIFIFLNYILKKLTIRRLSPPEPWPLHKELILGRADETHTPTVVAAAPIIRIEIAIAKPHAARVVAIVVRSRPVVAVGTDVEDTCPAPAARSGQEDCAVGLEFIRPICLGDTIAVETRIILVGVA